jgi:hypothetical protein
MLKFFRKIRYDLMEKNKTGKYFKYAVGEIILVVIGILIALQVNNWNEKRKLQNESQEILKALNVEFKNNRAVLKDRIDYLEDANKYVQAVLKLTKSDESQLRQVNIDSIISLSLKYGNYNPANSTIQELISSGKLNLIENGQLKDNLFNWLQILEDTDEDFKNQDLQAITMLEVYLSKNISFKNTVTYHPLDFGDGKSELFNGKYEQIFNDLEFENLYYGKRFWNTVMINHYKELDILAQEIIDQTKNTK